MRSAKISKSDRQICKAVLGIKGLVSQGEVVSEILRKTDPHILFVSISQEQVDGLSQFLREPFEMNLSDYEIIYGVRLSKYGEVMTPPPIYTEAVKFSEERGVPIIGLDMNEAEYSDSYQKNVGAFSLIRHSLRKRSMLRKDYKDSDPYSFVDAWGRQMDRVKALKNVDLERARYMASVFEQKVSEIDGEAFMIFDYELWPKFKHSLQNLGYHVDEDQIP
ncbi:MAG: hypothetical protein QXV22_03660 [Thermoplasmataceae archaeon]